MTGKFFLATAAFALCGLGPAAADEQESVSFEISHPTHGETFIVRTSDPAVIASARAELARPFEQRALHPTGVLVRGDGGYNAAWSWRLAEDDWRLAEISMEVCDAWPGYVEANLDRWLSEVGSFCPWSSRVSRELE